MDVARDRRGLGARATVPWYRLPALHRMLDARGAIPASSRAAGYVEVPRIVSAR